MARVVIYDPAHENERVTSDLGDVNTLDYLARVGVDAVIDPDTSGFTEPDLYWRHDTGAIREMDAGEKAALDAEIAADQIARNQDFATGEVAANSGHGVRTRAVVQMSVVGDNISRQWLTDFKVAVAGAANLAQFKAAVAALPDMPPWDKQQAKDMYLTIVTDGDAD